MTVMTFQFKIQIQGISQPLVWRKIAVPANFTFLMFHDVIQTAFGWEGYHLFEFKDKEYQGNIHISVPVDEDFTDPEFFAGTRDASTVRLADIFGNNIRKFIYVYDFGDSWIHDIMLETVSDDKAKKAVCLSGKGACPPEDCGGIYGYEEMKDIFKTAPDSREADEYRDWLGLDGGENWEANAFDIDEVNSYLEQITQM
jgi:hypothetical protein